MPETIRSLIVVLVLAVPAFYIGRQIASSIIPDREFVIWRNIWFAVTVAAFLSANFLVHTAVIFMVCYYARSVRAASPGLFLILLLAVPLGNFEIGGAGIINSLINLNNARLLSIFLLVPMFFARRAAGHAQASVYTLPDWLIVSYVFLLLALQLRSSEATGTAMMRSGTIYVLDVLIPYFAFSRLVTSVEDVRKVFLALVIAVLPLALIAVFELAKGWHLYAALSAAWGSGSSYLRRAGMLRASASAFESITFGFVAMTALGCMLGIWPAIRTPRIRKIVSGAFAAGLIATLARGPWVGSAVLLAVYFAIKPNQVANVGKLAAIGVVALVLFSLIPGSARLLQFLPFIGSVDEGSVTYRQQLFENSMAVIQQYPIFGTVDYRKTPEMIAMRNGEGLIDIVNTYLEIAMRSGLVGLGLYVGIFASILLRLRRMLKSNAVKDQNFRNLAYASVATLTAMLVTIATVSSIDFIPYVMWSFAGLCVGIIRVGYKERSAAVKAANLSRAAV